MFCGFICVGIALSAILTPSFEGTEAQHRQIDAFVAMVQAQMPQFVGSDEERAAIRRELVALATPPPPTTVSKVAALIPFYRAPERRLVARADLLAERAAAALRRRDAAGYLREVGTLYAELGLYPGDRAGQFVKAWLASIVYPLAPSLLVAGGLVMMAQPELCGAEPGTILDRVLIGLGAPGLASNVAVIGTARGRAWLASIGDPALDQARGVARVTARFWTRVSELAGESVHPAAVLGAGCAARLGATCHSSVAPVSR